ncbi:MAG: hypothetical protein IKB97_02410 [Bacteroidaceae bacterium]|nr:hypothetical protein [Bacteroidaceae bacterium]
MFTMVHDIQIGDYRIGMLDKVSIHRSVELLADTATITLPAAQFNVALEVEDKIHRGDVVIIRLGYDEVGIKEEFRGYLQSISTDGGDITLNCEDELHMLRKDISNKQYKAVSLETLLKEVLAASGVNLKVKNTYQWTYESFVISDATAYDVLKKVQEECGADIYIKDGELHIHPPGEVVGIDRFYNFALNVESADLTYRSAADKKVKVVVKATMPDGTVKEVEVGATGGDKVEIKSPTSDDASMKQRGEEELLRRSFDGYDGSITTWLIPECMPGDIANLHDEDYPKKDGAYFVRSVTTEFSSSGGSRKVELGFRLS